MQNRKLKKKRRVPVSAQKAALEFASQHLRAAQTQKEVFMWVVMQGDDYDDDEVISRHGTENTPMDAAIALVDEDSTTLNQPGGSTRSRTRTANISEFGTSLEGRCWRAH